MPLNAVRFAAKRKAKCWQMQNEKHKNTLQWYKQNLLEPLKTWLKGAKCTLKSGVLVVKTAFLEPLKKRKDNQIERQNGAKCRQNHQKWTRKELCKAENCSKKHVFQPKILLEWSVKRSAFCKISAPKLTKR